LISLLNDGSVILTSRCASTGRKPVDDDDNEDVDDEFEDDDNDEVIEVSPEQQRAFRNAFMAWMTKVGAIVTEPRPSPPRRARMKRRAKGVMSAR
jgi:hypothetical protein